MPRSSASTRACGLISWAAKIPFTGARSGSRFSSSRYLVSCSTPSISPRRLISMATEPPPASRHIRATEPPALAEDLHLRGQQFLQVRFDAVLDQAGIDPQVDGGVADDLLDGDRERLARLARYHPPARFLGQPAGRGHPVQRLVRAAVGVNQDGAVRLDHYEPGSRGQPGRQAARVIYAAPGDDESHRSPL